MQATLLPVGSRVFVTGDCPFHGLRGTITTVFTLPDRSEEPYCYYQIALEGASNKEPIWLEEEEVEDLAVAPAMPQD
jgi:hypothetical protein